MGRRVKSQRTTIAIFDIAGASSYDSFGDGICAVLYSSCQHTSSSSRAPDLVCRLHAGNVELGV